MVNLDDFVRLDIFQDKRFSGVPVHTVVHPAGTHEPHSLHSDVTVAETVAL
jgi:hypothetical protein